jgi:hypothetical protein
MSEIIDFKSKGEKSAKHRKTEASPNNIMKELRKKFPKNEEDDPEYEALNELIKLAIKKKLDNGEAATRFDAILALIKEEALKLCELTTERSEEQIKIADMIEDISDLITRLQCKLDTEAKFPSASSGAA